MKFVFLPLIILSLCLGAQFSFAQSHEGKKVLFLIGEREYGTPATLPVFAKEQLEPLGIESSFLMAKSDDRASVECHEFDGIGEALGKADVLVLSLRRRYPKSEDLTLIREWIESGKPTLAIRTSSHAFGEREKGEGYQAPEGHAAWNTFDVDVLGAGYRGHYNSNKDGESGGVEAWVEADKASHSIVRELAGEPTFQIDDKLYRYVDLDPEVEVLMSGRYTEGEPKYPIAWINEKDGKRVFYASPCGVDEMALPQIQNLLKGAVIWGLESKSVKKKPIASSARGKEALGEGLSAEESFQSLIAGEGLAIDLIESEPAVAQPSFIRFDERGRMWVVQYRQYPLPAGLKIASRDKFWRNAYDQIPAPPGSPDHVPGRDLITIHEDQDGDGSFETVKPFLEGLSLATSVAWDREGVWVLQAPYLLFYPDRDHDDVVDGEPEVVLSGFGIQDSHAIVNSLTWGPDGWLYGAQGSTVTASVTVMGSDAAPVKSVGQQMWRYHPKKRVYEVFAEGGGNIWSCQFDSKGRLFAGTNQGRVMGYHYLQGSYNRKSFTKHGELSNPHVYGYFKGMADPKTQRVTTNLMIYEEGKLPARLEGAILASNPLTAEVTAAKRIPNGASFRAEGMNPLLDGVKDRWVRPVYIETGPDGAVYVADWYDQQVNHFRNHEGKINPQDGRIYRIRSVDSSKGMTSLDLGKASSEELLEYLKDDRRWYRNTARRLLNERQDKSLLPELRKWLKNETGQTALEALWAINLLEGFKIEERKIALNHEDPHVRAWAVRLIGDEKKASSWEMRKMEEMAALDPNVEVRQQLASSAKRLIGVGSLGIIRELIQRDEDSEDEYMPLMLWWALEAACTNDAAEVVRLFDEEELYTRKLIESSLLGFTMRRLASEGKREALALCAQLMKNAKETRSKEILLRGFEEAYRGRSMAGLPVALLDELNKAGGGSLAMQLRQGSSEAIEKAKAALSDPELDISVRRRIIEALGEAPQASLLNVLLAQLDSEDETVQEATLSSLRSYDDGLVGESVVRRFPAYGPRLQAASQALLLNRPSWALAWLGAILSGEISKTEISSDALRSLKLLKDSKIDGLLAQLWPQEDRSIRGFGDEAERIRKVITESSLVPDLYNGRVLYSSLCSACHVLHGEGGAIGPELTGYQRHDLESLLFALTDPSAEIREGFENYVVKTNDGLTYLGFIEDKDEHVLALRPIGGQRIIIDQGKIESMEGAGFSLMPSGLLVNLESQELVDFFAYLQSSQPLDVRK